MSNKPSLKDDLLGLLPFKKKAKTVKSSHQDALELLHISMHELAMLRDIKRKGIEQWANEKATNSTEDRVGDSSFKGFATCVYSHFRTNRQDLSKVPVGTLLTLLEEQSQNLSKLEKHELLEVALELGSIGYVLFKQLTNKED